MDNYNDIPVFYCKKCLSLKIKSVIGMDYCDDCNSTNIDKCHIKEWEKMYEERYGYKLLEKPEY
jgi:hypothetical protein